MTPKRAGPLLSALLPLSAAAALVLGAGAPGERLARIPGQRDRANEPSLAVAVTRLDPAADGWDSEVFAEAASRQLEAIAQRVVSGRPLDADLLKGMTAADFACRALRPAGLKEVYRDGALTVRRAAAANGHATGPAAYTGAAGLTRALSDLLRPIAGGAAPRVEFQIVGVEAKPDAADATVRFHAAGRTASGSVEMTAQWRTRWVRPAPPAAPGLRSIEVLDYEEVTGPPREGPLFADATEAVLGANRSFKEDLLYGVDHWLERIESWVETDAFGHNGIAVGDVNGDGLDDLYVCQMAGLPNRLFLQNPDGTATEVSSQAGVDWLERTRSALFLDLDNDGDEDLVVATSVALLFMENDGSGRFTVKASLSAAAGMVTAGAPPVTTRTGGIPEEGMEGGHYQRSGDFGAVKTSDIVSLAAADYDNDGFTDIYACAYHNSGEEANRFPLPMPYHDANNGGPNLMIRNEGSWRFANVTQSSGLDVNNRRFSFAAAWEDFDNDGDQDLYVANDFGRNNLYRNDGGRFTDIAAQAEVEDIAAGMSASWGDYDNDGWMDLYVGNMFSVAGNRIAPQKQFMQAADAATLAMYRHHAMGNTLYHNTRDGKFADVSMEAAVSMGRWAWSSNFIDFDNNGWEDMLVANGYFTKEDPADLSGFFWRDVVGGSPAAAVAPAEAPIYAQAWRDLGGMIHRGRSFSGRERNCAFLNTRGARFANVSATTGLDFIDDARAIAVTDWDGDGDLDVWIANRTGPRVRFARNDASGPNHHLDLRLEGRKANRDAVGARVEVHLAGTPPRRLVRTLRAGEGYLAQSSKWVHFGLGAATSIGKVVVRWPGGAAEEFTGLGAGGRYRIVEGEGKAAKWGGPPRRVQLAAAELPLTPAVEKARIFLSAPAPAPSLEYENLDAVAATPSGGGPLLVYLWSLGDPVSMGQLGEIGRRAAELRGKGLRVLALSVDGVGRGEPPDPTPVRKALEGIGFPFEAGFAYPDMIDKLDLLQNKVIWAPRPFPVPTGLLVDGDGLLAAVYKGPLPIDQLLADLPSLRVAGEKRVSLAIPFAGMRQGRGTPDFFDYMDAIAQAYADGGYPGEAVSYYRKVVRIQPGRAKAHYGLANALAGMGSGDEALAEYRETVRIDPNNAAALNDLGLALAAIGKTDEAIDAYRRAIEADGKNVAALCNLGAALSAQGKVDEAVALYRRALEAEPDSPLALNNLAVALARQGKDDEAVAQYQRVLRIDPLNVPARLNLAAALTRRGKNADAADVLKEAVRLKPDQAETHASLGIALARLGRSLEAIQQLAEALRLKPDYSQAQYHLAILFARAGRVEEAVSQFADLMKLQPGSPAAAEKLAWILATSPDASLRGGAQAIRLAQSACEATGNAQAGPLDALGAAFAEAGRFQEAAGAARKALDLATAAGDQAASEKIRVRLQLYESGKPYRE